MASAFFYFFLLRWHVGSWRGHICSEISRTANMVENAGGFQCNPWSGPLSFVNFKSFSNKSSFCRIHTNEISWNRRTDWLVCKKAVAIVAGPLVLLLPENDCARPRSLQTLRHCAVYCYTLAGLYCTIPTTCDNNKKVFQLRKEVTALVASFGVHTTIIKACSRRNRLGRAGMSKAAKNSGTGLILTDEGVTNGCTACSGMGFVKCGFPSGRRHVRRVGPSARVKLMDNPSTPGS